MFIKSVSPSKLKTYNECHAKYKFQYIDRLPQIFNENSNTDALQYGQYIHRIFELGYECGTVEEIHQIAKDIRENYEFEGYGPKKIANCVNNFYEFNKSLSKTADVERKFEVEVDSFTLNGIIDRVIIGEEGGILVLDYKTSKRMSTPSELYSDPQMLMYAFAAHNIYDVPYNKITLGHYYPTQDKLVTIRLPQGKVEQYIRQKVKEKVWEIRKRKKDQFRSMYNNFCPWCGFRGICDQFNSQPEIDKLLLESEDAIAEAKAKNKAYWDEQNKKEGEVPK